VQRILSTIYKRTAVIFLVLGGFFAPTISKAQFYTGSQMEFGKSRIKYENFFWTYYSYPGYDVYFYEQGRELANYVSKSAKQQLESIEKLFDYSFDGRIQFIVYNKQSDFKQSNIGLSTEEQFNTGGVTRIVGSKVILYYEGDHAKLDAQIRAGIAEVLINQLMYGGSAREMLKNSTLLNLPPWFIKGLIDYTVYDWNSDIDNRVKDGIETGKYKNINHLEGEDAVIAGHALWKHIADNYGEAVISNILYMAKVSRNIDNSTLFVMGISVKNLWRECYETYKRKYDDKDSTKVLPQEKLVLKKPKASRIYGQLKVSSDGNNILYTTNELGQIKIWWYDVLKNKTKRIFKADHKIDRITDVSYPLLAWHPSGKIFSYLIERKGYLVLNTYELETKAKTARNIIGFEKILDYSYNTDGKKIVMSAVQNGQTDIYIFTVSSNAYDQVTKDIYDDLTPRFVQGDKQIVFASSRPNDSLFFDSKRNHMEAQKYKDIFAFNNQTKSPALLRVTNTPGLDERYPADYDSSHISYLSDVNGIRNRYIARFDSVIAFVDTAAHYRTVVTSKPVSNYSRNIIEQDVNVKANKYTEVIYEKGRYRMFVSPIVKSESIPVIQLKNTSYRNYKDKLENKELSETNEKNKILTQTPQAENVKEVINIADPEPQQKDSTVVDINDYAFDGDQKKKVDPTSSTVTDSLVNRRDDEFQLGKQRNYNLNYSVDYVVSQLDNSFLNSGYQKFTGGGSPIYLNPGLNGLFKIGISDLFEDYRIVGAMRFSIDLSGNEYYLSYENRINNLDRQIVLHRQSLLNIANNNTSLIKIQTNEAKYILKHPFSEVLSLRGTIGYRNDRIIYLSTDETNLRKPNTFENWGNLKLEYVFDNTIQKGLNLYNGMRAKLFGEYYRQIDKAETDFFVLGFDARYYKKIHRDLIWANRIAGSTSFGNKKLIYYMGGVDNWFGPRFDNSTNIANDQNYAYQTLATPMRGFYQNVRNGNSFAVINSEIRFPIFKYLYKRPIRSDFIQNFQVIAFGDVGTAWTGSSPYSSDNSLNTKVIGSTKTPYLITLNTQHNPIVGGYGWGLRSRIFGYFIRLDRAWGVQDGIILKPLWYLSFTLDF
jgi:Tol biopolymer transport system component